MALSNNTFSICQLPYVSNGKGATKANVTSSDLRLPVTT